jgi:hypothetical protein
MQNRILKSTESPRSSPAVSAAAAEVRAADARLLAAKAEARLAKTRLKRAKRAFKAARKAVRKAGKLARKAHKTLRAAVKGANDKKPAKAARAKLVKKARPAARTQLPARRRTPTVPSPVPSVAAVTVPVPSATT